MFIVKLNNEHPPLFALDKAGKERFAESSEAVVLLSVLSGLHVGIV